MKINLAGLKVGDTIKVDCGYDGMEDMQKVKIISIGKMNDLWVSGKIVPCVSVMMKNGEKFILSDDLFV